MKEKVYYLYRHIRVDKNEVFYIGIGTKRGNSYPRANSYFDRNKFWISIVSKTEIKVDIVIEDTNYEYIKQKEIEFISLYGRRDLGMGTLVNLTDGGEGSIGAIVSEETRLKHRLRSKGNTYRLNKKHTDEIKVNMSLSRRGVNHPMFGKKHSKESINKMKRSQTGSKKSESTKLKHKKRASMPNQCNRKPCMLIDILSGEKWESISITEMSMISPLSKSTLIKIKNGQKVNKNNLKYKFINL